MSTTPPSQALTTDARPGTGQLAAQEGAFGWLRALGPRGRRAFAGAFGGYALDSYDYFTLPLSMVALAAYFGLDSGQTGLFTTVTLVVSAVGGAVAGVVADRIGRVKALMITVITYAVFTVACGFAPNYETLLVFRALQGLGFGGEWAVGAILVAEYASAKHRGRTLGAIQSSWAVGWGMAVVVYTLVFQYLGDDLAWRVMFWTGALPALLVLWVRRRVQDAPEAAAEREKSAQKGSFAAIFTAGTAETPGLLRTTFFAVLLSTGVQGGYYTLDRSGPPLRPPSRQPRARVDPQEGALQVPSGHVRPDRRSHRGPHPGEPDLGARRLGVRHAAVLPAQPEALSGPRRHRRRFLDHSARGGRGPAHRSAALPGAGTRRVGGRTDVKRLEAT